MIWNWINDMRILAVISVIAMKVEIKKGAHACEFKTTVPQSHLPPTMVWKIGKKCVYICVLDTKNRLFPFNGLGEMCLWHIAVKTLFRTPSYDTFINVPNPRCFRLPWSMCLCHKDADTFLFTELWHIYRQCRIARLSFPRRWLKFRWYGIELMICVYWLHLCHSYE